MSTIRKIGAGAIAVALMAFIPTTASAATYEVGNSSKSVYRIKIYTDSHCSQGYDTLDPGWHTEYPSYRSTRVYAYSRIKRPGHSSYGPLIAPNVCIKINDKGRTWVKNYSVA